MRKKPPAYHDELSENYTRSMNEYLLPLVIKSPGLLDELPAFRRHSFIKEAAEHWLRQMEADRKRTQNLPRKRPAFARRVFDGWFYAVGGNLPERKRFKAAQQHLIGWGVAHEVSERTLSGWLKEVKG